MVGSTRLGWPLKMGFMTLSGWQAPETNTSNTTYLGIGAGQKNDVNVVQQGKMPHHIPE